MQAQFVLTMTTVLLGSSSTGWKYSLTNPSGWADAAFDDSSWLTPVANSQTYQPWGNKCQSTMAPPVASGQVILKITTMSISASDLTSTLDGTALTYKVRLSEHRWCCIYNQQLDKVAG